MENKENKNYRRLHVMSGWLNVEDNIKRGTTGNGNEYIIFTINDNKCWQNKIGENEKERPFARKCVAFDNEVDINKMIEFAKTTKRPVSVILEERYVKKEAISKNSNTPFSYKTSEYFVKGIDYENKLDHSQQIYIHSQIEKLGQNMQTEATAHEPHIDNHVEHIEEHMEVDPLEPEMYETRFK